MKARRISEAENLVESQIGPYTLLGVLGIGATAAVFNARHEDGSSVALKVSRAGLLNNRKRGTRFLREVQAMKRIRHAASTQLLDWGIHRDVVYIAMELVEGDDLAQLLARSGKLNPQDAVAIAIAIAQALAAAHEMGVIHRDLKPKHVKVVSRDPTRIKIFDFGLAKLFRGLGDEEQTNAQTLTRAGSTLGTPHYMAPEQLNRADTKTDVRVDVYSLGVILYELVTGQVPYDGPNIVSVLTRLSAADFTPPRAHLETIDADLERIILKAIAPKAEDRHPTAFALLADLETLADKLEEQVADSTTIYRPTKPSEKEEEAKETVTTALARRDDRVIVRISHYEDEDGQDGPTVVARTDDWPQAKSESTLTLDEPTRHRPTVTNVTRGSSAPSPASGDEMTIKPPQGDKNVMSQSTWLTVVLLMIAVGLTLIVWLMSP